MGTFTGTTLLHNYMPFLPQDENQHSVSLNQLILDENGRLPTRATLATYVCDWQWLFQLLPPASTQLVVALHWNPRTGVSELPFGDAFKDGSTSVSVGEHDVEVVHPRMLGQHQAAVIHAKLFLFEFQSALRVVISSANLTRHDWEGLAQTVWVQDFARVNPPPQQLAEFGVDLADFVFQLGIFETLAEAQQYLQPFDFSPAIVKLIASVPGIFSGVDAFKYGHARLRSLLSSYNFTPHTTGAVYQASSVGHTSIPWLQQFLVSISGEKVDPIIFPTSAYDIDDPKPLTKPNLHVVFPTKKMCEKSLEEDLGAIVLSYYDTANNIENLKMLYKPLRTRGHAIHSKILMSLQNLLGNFTGWVYSGSHNFTVDSWGTLEEKDGEYKNTIYNYELGILFPPSTPSSILANLQLPFQGMEPYKTQDVPWRIAKERKTIMNAQQQLEASQKFNPVMNYHFFRFAEHK